jgi:hypothetical protein
LLPRHDVTGFGWEGGARGSPESEDLSLAANSNPSRKEDSLLHRTRALLAATVAALVVAPAALAVDVHVRVEGRTTTIYGSAQPLLAVPGTALDALETASSVGEFYYHVAHASFGSYVDQIGRWPAAGNAGWVFKVNGALPPVGADAVQLRNGDTVLWYYAEFDAQGSGPPTLDLRRVGKHCYQVWQQDDKGVRTRAAGTLLTAGSRRIRTSHGHACIKGRHGAVRATRAGSVRSQTVK